MKMLARASAGLLLLSVAAQAAPPAPSPAATLRPPSELFAPTSMTSDDGLSPLERWEKGMKWSGAFSLYDASHCSRKAADARLDSMWKAIDEKERSPAPYRVLEPKGEITWGGGVYTVDVAKMQEVTFAAIDAWMKPLIAAGDPQVAQHHVCVGIADIGEPNAVATGSGFVFVDPRVATLPEDAAVPFRAYEAILAHELAHQLQYWGGNAFLKDKTVRRTELVADCVAGALLTLDTLREGKPETVAGSITLGEKLFRNMGGYAFWKPGFHGTPDDRAAAVPVGMLIAKDVHAAKKPATGVALKAACEEKIAKWKQDFSITDLLKK